MKIRTPLLALFILGGLGLSVPALADVRCYYFGEEGQDEPFPPLSEEAEFEGGDSEWLAMGTFDAVTFRLYEGSGRTILDVVDENDTELASTEDVIDGKISLAYDGHNALCHLE